MIINNLNLYDICFDDNAILIGLSCVHTPLTLKERFELSSNFFWQSLVFGDVGDYSCTCDVHEGLLILKPHFFLKRDGDRVSMQTLSMIDDYGGRIVRSAYDIIEYENSNLPRMDTQSRWY